MSNVVNKPSDAQAEVNALVEKGLVALESSISSIKSRLTLSWLKPQLHRH